MSVLERQEEGKELFSQSWFSVCRRVVRPVSGRFLNRG